MRLGFSVKIYGRADLAAPMPSAHLSVHLAHWHDVLCYLREKRLPMYRLETRFLAETEFLEASSLRAVDECAGQLAALGELARAAAVRLSFHPYSDVVLNSPNQAQADDSASHLRVLAALLDAMTLGPEAVIVLHVGGVYDDLTTSAERFARRYLALPEAVRRRVVLENDDHRFGYDAVRRIHAATSVPLVFDWLHHQVHNPAHEPWPEALAHALTTWPPGVLPKVHYATPRTELRTLPGTGRIKLPTWTEHSDFVNPFAFVDFLRATAGLPPFDVMIECKARDLAVLKLREDVARYAPEFAEAVGE